MIKKFDNTNYFLYYLTKVKYTFTIKLPKRNYIIYLYLHNNTSIGIFITKRRRILNLSRARTCQARSPRINHLHISHVPSWSFLIVHPGCVGVINDVVWHIGPHLRFLSGAVPHTVQNLLRVHIANHSEPVLLGVHFYLYSYDMI